MHASSCNQACHSVEFVLLSHGVRNESYNFPLTSCDVVFDSSSSNGIRSKVCAYLWHCPSSLNNVRVLTRRHPADHIPQSVQGSRLGLTSISYLPQDYMPSLVPRCSYSSGEVRYAKLEPQSISEAADSDMSEWAEFRGSS